MSGDDRHIFHDPTGKRDRRMRLILGIGLSALAAIVAAFLATLAFAPRLPSVILRDPHILSSLHKETAHRLKPTLAWRKVPRPAAAAGIGPARPISVGFYVSWDEDSRESLRRNIDKLDVVSPQWVALKSSAGDVTVDDDPQGVARIAAAPNHPAVLPPGPQLGQCQLQRPASRRPVG